MVLNDRLAGKYAAATVSTVSLWKHSDFLKLWTGQTVSRLGSVVTRTALPLVALLTLGAGPPELAFLVISSSAGTLLVGLVAGAWVDRLRRRPVLVWTDVIRAALLFWIPIAYAIGALRIEQLYAVAFIEACLASLFNAAYPAYVPSLIGTERVVEERRPRLVTVFGPAGIGKSRLALEFAEEVVSRGGRALRGRSMPYGTSSTYSVFAQHVKQIAGVFDSDEPVEARTKLTAALVELLGTESDGAEHAQNLGMLLGLGGEGEAHDRDTLFFSARVLVEAFAAREPTLLVFEDIHWSESSLLDLLEALAARVQGVPVLLLALARPEILTERPTWGGGLPAYTALPLERLSDDHAQELASRLLEGHEIVATQAPTVAQTGEGNPLFIEELAASLAERTTTGAQELPTSIREIVAARLDALPTGERSVLLDAAVVGRVFWRGALTRMQPRDDLQALLGSLEQRDLVRREAISRIQSDQQFAFKHGLIRDVAYQTLPRAARRDRHSSHRR